MIRVLLAPEPSDFGTKVREPGMSAISELTGQGKTIKRPGRHRKQLVVRGNPIQRPEDIPAEQFPPFWTESLDDLLLAYKRICAYVCIYIEPVTGASSVDHMISKSIQWSQIYEWSNYRLACSLMNSRKHDARDVLDPFEIQNSWFQIEFTGFQVVPNPELDQKTVGQIQKTIDRLKLNERECRELREEYVICYEKGEIKLSFLERRAPFIAMELQRQGKLQHGIQ